jgi:hypothetical protein
MAPSGPPHNNALLLDIASLVMKEGVALVVVVAGAAPAALVFLFKGMIFSISKT